jgi:hypothetical protein
MRHDLGYFDLEQKALQHLDNQSWSRLADCPRPNWLPAWTPASQRSPDRRAAQTLPSTKTFVRYAMATGSKFHVRLSAA